MEYRCFHCTSLENTGLSRQNFWLSRQDLLSLPSLRGHQPNELFLLQGTVRVIRFFRNLNFELRRTWQLYGEVEFLFISNAITQMAR